MIYFDYGATSKKREYLIKEILDDFDSFNGNPDSQHRYGRMAKKILEQAREDIAKSINANSKQIVFTSGASESNNTVIKSFNKKGAKIISSNIEHPSVLEPIKGGSAEFILLDAQQNGKLNTSDLEKYIDEDTKLVSLIYVNNETGSIQDLEKVQEYLADKDIWFHIDAVQAYGHIDIDVERLKCDSISLSGHKIGGLNGFGVLYLRGNLESLVSGGNQEKKRRAGTSFVMGAYTMAKAYPYMVEERAKIKEIKDYFIKALDQALINYEINGDIDTTSDHVLNIYLPFVKSDFLLTFLDLNGVCASAGSACTAGALEPSHVISNMYDKDRALHSIRFSFGYENEKEEVDKVIQLLKQLQEGKNNEGK